VQLVSMESSSHLSRQNVKVKREPPCLKSQPQCSGLFQNCTCQESNGRPQLPPSNSLPSFLFLEALSSLIRPTTSYNTQALHEGSPQTKHAHLIFHKLLTNKTQHFSSSSTASSLLRLRGIDEATAYEHLLQGSKNCDHFLLQAREINILLAHTTTEEPPMN